MTDPTTTTIATTSRTVEAQASRIGHPMTWADGVRVQMRTTSDEPERHRRLSPPPGVINGQATALPVLERGTMKLARATALTVTALAGLTPLTGVAQAETTPQAQTAAAPNCDWRPRTNGSGAMRTTKPIRLRYGPAASCDWIGWSNMPTGQKLWAWCKTVNGSGNTWYYVRPDEDGWDPGWIYSGNVDGVSSGIPKCS